MVARQAFIVRFEEILRTLSFAEVPLKVWTHTFLRD